jgi:hypothetical protein
MFNYCGEFLDAVSYEKGSKIGIDNFKIQQVVTKDMALEVNFLNTMIYGNI